MTDEDTIEEGTSRIELTVELSETGGSGTRLDQYLASALADFSRSRIQKLIEEGSVLVDGKPEKASLRLKGGESIEVSVGEPEPLDVVPEDLPIEIVYQDENLAVVNKPAGMVTHPGAGINRGTLVNALLFRIGDSLAGISGTLRPGIVHRLDKDTSGLIVVAKNDRALIHLQKEIKARKAKRIYYALVEGVMKEDSGTIDRPVGRHPTRRQEMWVVENGRQARTHFRVLERYHKFTFVELALETGRTHQIRVHMSFSNYPVAGDIVYNRKTTGTLEARRKLGLQGQALHAAQLSFTHPVTGVLLEFEARLPDDFQSLIDRLRGVG